ncbi:DASH family cryptochrome [Motilimonas eburnea]|uniref:DASH family cryptochrome n=1 Tax=Motilimonas eburnea TaxID=1737488 RepID=UPI001E623531|nr:DASH family cryptochrome [Motilimonas eburnea]MCE2570689.1 DASH family cryptochrome [Motilimonas eburnea]
MKSGLFWFGQDLRLQDNRTLAQFAQQVDALGLVYVVDPRWFASTNYHHKWVGEQRWRLICESLQQLRDQLHPHGHELLVVHGKPEQVIPQLAQQWQVDVVGHGEQVGLFEQQLWRQIQQTLPGLEYISCWDSTLFSLSQLNMTSETLGSFSRFRKVIEKTPLLPRPPYHFELTALPTSLVNREQAKQGWMGLANYGEGACEQRLLEGGELSAIAHMQRYFRSGAPARYKQTRNELDGWQNSSKLSHFLALGNVSPRQVWQQIKGYESEFGANDSTYWLGFELWWREYFQWLALHIKADLYRFQGLATKPPLTSYYSGRFIQWCQGQTPFPLVNACMKQLNQTGYMSNRGRQIVASCLVNELGVDWRYGAAYFQQQLADHDVAANWGNWQYIAGVGVDPRGGRHFNVAKQTEHYDPLGDFVARWQGDAGQLPLDSIDAADWPC